MTIRSIILGLLAAAFICSVTFFNDMVMHGTNLVGNYVPISVFGGLLLFVLLANPLLGRISKRLRLRGGELAVAMAIALFACYVPGRGLMHYFTTFMMMPHDYARNWSDWQGGLPQVTGEDVQDWPKLSGMLRAAMDRPESPIAQAAARLPAEELARLKGAVHGDAAQAASRDAILLALNAFLDDREFSVSPLPPDALAPEHVRLLRERDPANLWSDQVQLLNRGLLEMSFGGTLRERRPGVLEDVPRRMLTDIRGDPPKDDKKYDPKASNEELGRFISGIPKGKERISFRDIPWVVWERCLMFWVPLILTVAVAGIAMALIVHRQWSKHEHLPYPTVEFAQSLLPDENGGLNSLFRGRMFWIAAGFVFLIHMDNYACVWWPDTLIPIQRTLDLTPLLQIVPVMARGDWAAQLFTPMIVFLTIGFAYFIPTDVSLSMGVAAYVYCLAGGLMATYGIPMTGGFDVPSIQSGLHAGAYVAMFLCLMYAGRHYYLSALRRGLFFRGPKGAEDSYVAWATRVFLAAFVLAVVQLALVGVEWQMAVLYLIGLFVIYTVISRLLAEAGVFFVHAFFFPCALLWTFLGSYAGGPEQLLLLGMVSALLVSDPREAIMPFTVSALRLADFGSVRLGRLARWGTAALVMGLAIAIPVTLYWQYQYGEAKTSDSWTRYVPMLGFGSHVTVRNTLEDQGLMSQATSVSGWRRFVEASPERGPAVAFGISFACVMVFMFLRHRFAWWPLHPALFLVLGTYQSRTLAFSFLVGWALKSVVIKYGGGQWYNRLKPAVIGLIAGELLGAIVPIIVGAIYYLVTGEPPKSFTVLPP